MSDPYSILGVAADASTTELEAGYIRARARALAAAGGDQEAAQEDLAALDRAWAELTDRHAPEISAPVTVKGAHLKLATVDAQSLAPQLLPDGRPARLCPYCGLANPVQVSTCGQCHQQIMRECPACGYPIGIAERVCARCETAIVEHDQRHFAQALSVQRQVQDERGASDTRVRVLEAGHLARAWQGVLFYIVVALLIVGALGLVVMSLVRR
jgi:hypothetical protein